MHGFYKVSYLKYQIGYLLLVELHLNSKTIKLNEYGIKVIT